jgi:hypothetical protein
LSTTFARRWTNKQKLHRNSICLTIGQAIGIRRPYMCRPIVGLFSNYNHNYLFGSSVGASCASEMNPVGLALGRRNALRNSMMARGD